MLPAAPAAPVPAALPVRAVSAPVVTLPVVAELLVMAIMPPLPPAAFPPPAFPPLAVTAPADVLRAPFEAMAIVPAFPPAWLAPFPLLPFAVMAPVVVTVRPDNVVLPALRPAVPARAVPPVVWMVEAAANCSPLCEDRFTDPPWPFDPPAVLIEPVCRKAPAAALFCVTVMLPAAPPAPVPTALPLRAMSAPVVRFPDAVLVMVIVPALPPA